MRRAIVLALVFAALALSACGNSASTSSNQPASVPTNASGQQLVQAKCGRCHTLDRVNAAKKDRAGWEATVERMNGRGAGLSQDEVTKVVDYLVKRDGGQ